MPAEKLNDDESLAYNDPNDDNTPPHRDKFTLPPPTIQISVDCVIFGFDVKKLKILLIKRSSEPEIGKWALPGDLIPENATVEEAAARTLKKYTGISNIYMEQLKVFSRIDRHPVGRVITVPFYALTRPENYHLHPAYMANEAQWFEIDNLPDALGYDHQEILDYAQHFLKKEMRTQPIGFELLPEKFTLSDLQTLFEVVLDEKVDRRNFRRKINAMHILKQLDEVRKGPHIGARLYSFDNEAFKKMKEEGFDFLIR